MIIKRKDTKRFFDIFNKLSEKVFNINTQYKFILLKKEIEKDGEIIEEQFNLLFEKYAEKDENGKIISLKEKGIKIKDEYMQICLDKVTQISEQNITLPDIYFTLDELEELGLTLPELQVLEPFIKI